MDLVNIVKGGQGKRWQKSLTWFVLNYYENIESGWGGVGGQE